MTKKPSSTHTELADKWTQEKKILDKAFQRVLNKKNQTGGKKPVKDYDFFASYGSAHFPWHLSFVLHCK